MINGNDILRRTAAAVAIAAHGAISCAAAADGTSAWDGDARSAVRLIAGSTTGGETADLRAGLEIRLKPGWHTYWRYPGDAGVPPRFSFAGSQNLQAVDVRFPAPQRIPEQGLTVIGYTADVILPLVVVPLNPSKSVKLRLELDYAVCEKLCVPAAGKAELLLPASRAVRDSALADAQARVPKKVALGEGSILAIRSVRREHGPVRGSVIVEVAAPSTSSVDLFAEGPTAEWALPVPVAENSAPNGLQRFTFDLDGAPPGAQYAGTLITLTAVAGQHSIEVTTRLD